jgi:pyruvate dehydrogenase E2 component (dihydrolipoamide acetyltransferase)
MRKIIAARVTEAKQTIPHFYLRREVRLDELLVIRSKINKSLEARKIKISVNDFIIKACALALHTTPTANSVWAGDSILQMKAADIAVAVAVDGGLLTPVLLDVETKLISQISVEMKDLADRARNQKLEPHEYQGGSFAISNLGMMGIDSFDAIINPPQAAILAVGVGKKCPSILEDGTLGVATMMNVTMSVDHRVIDGALGAELLGRIVANLENPAAMLA